MFPHLLRAWLCIVVFLVSGDALAQLTCEAKNQALVAESHFRSKADMEKTISLYRSAFALGLEDLGHGLDALESACIAKDTLAMHEFMTYCIEMGCPPYSLQKLWSHLGKGMDYDDLIAKVDTLTIISNYKSKLDTALVSQLKKLSDQDQRYRGDDNDDRWHLQLQLDSINWSSLKELVTTYGGIPSYTKIGLDGLEDLSILFYHMGRNELEWFIPYVLASDLKSDLGRIILYHLDRIGMSENVIYTISRDHKIVSLGPRTIMNNGYACQALGEWFNEKSRQTNLIYETPFDPALHLQEINRVRSMFCQDTIEQRRIRKPWVKVVSQAEFEKLISE